MVSPHDRLGSAILAGGIFAVILKSFQFQGIYHKALSDILYEDRFLDIRNDMNALWSRVTNHISNQRFKSLTPLLHADVLETYLPTKTDFYFENYIRKCTLDWADDSKKLVIFKEELSLDIVTTSKKTKVPYEFQFWPSDGVDLSVTGPEIDCLNIDGVDYVKNGEDLNGCVSKEGKTQIVKASLRGKIRYHVKRKTKRIFPLTVDPYQRYTSRRFLKGAKIIVHCIPDDLRVRFVSLGTLRDFESVLPENTHDLRKGDIIREYKGLLFPQQGFILIFQKHDKLLLEELEGQNDKNTGI